MADYPYRLNIKICTASEAAAVTEEGTPAVVSDGPSVYAFGVYSAGAWRYCQPYDDTLATIAAVSATSYGINMLGQTPATIKSYLGIETAVGGIWRNAAGVVQSIPPLPAVTKITPFDSALGDPTLVTEDYANNQLIVQKAGRYLLTFGRTYLTGTNNVLWTVMVYVNGVEQPHARRQVNVANASSPNYAELCTIINANAGDTVDIRLWHGNASAVNITYTYAELSLHSI